VATRLRRGVVAVVSEVQVADVVGNLDELPVVYDLANTSR